MCVACDTGLFEGVLGGLFREIQAEIDKLRARVSALEGEVDNAIAAEDFDAADQFQVDMDSAHVRHTL